MAVTVLTALDLTTNQLLNIKLQNLASDPAANESGLYYNTTAKEVRYHNGTSWIALGPAGAGGPPTGAASGHLTGSYPGPSIANGVVTDVHVAAANKDGAVGTASMRTLGTGSTQALAGNTRLDQITAPTASVALNSQKITGLATPSAASDAATMGYVDTVAQGLDTKNSVHAASTANIANFASAAPNTLDGVTLVANDRVLLKDQTTQSANGIYKIDTLGTGANGVWTRALDMDAWTEVPSAYVWVEMGTVNADTGWVCTADPGGTLGSTNITWAQFSSAGSAIAGAGLTKTGNTIDVVSATADMTVGTDNITIVSAPKWTTSRTLNLTGDVTGSVSFDGGSAIGNLVTAVGSTGTAPPKFYAGDVGSGTAVTITHNLNSRDVSVEIYRNSTPWDQVIADVERTTVNTLTLRFSTSVTAAAYRVVVTGR